jgi:hypothetical protein
MGLSSSTKNTSLPALSVNSVEEELKSHEVYQFKNRTTLRTRANKDEEQQDEAENLLETKKSATNPNDTVCPIPGCGYVFSLVDMNKSRRFNLATRQWICPPCLYFAETNGGIPQPVVKSRTSHDPSKVDLRCGVSWCANLMQNDQGLIRRMWHEESPERWHE